MALDPGFIDAIAKLGALGFALIAVGAFATGFIRPGSQVDRDRADETARREAREAQLVKERDEWRSIATDAIAHYSRLTDVLETLTGKKLG